MAGNPLIEQPHPGGVVIWGAAGHARVVRETLDRVGEHVVAVFDNKKVEPPFADVPLLIGEDGFLKWLTGIDRREQYKFVIAIGGSRGRDRLQIHGRLEGAGLRAHTTIHPTAFVANGVVCSPGVQVLAMAAVCAGAKLGAQSIVNTAATVDHECRIGVGVHVCPGAHLAGLVQVADFVTIGTGAVILPRIRIGEGATVGAGAVVRDHVPSGVTVVGNPARTIDRTSQ